MNEMELYSLWCEKAVDDPDLRLNLSLSQVTATLSRTDFTVIWNSVQAVSVVLSVQVHTE